MLLIIQQETSGFREKRKVDMLNLNVIFPEKEQPYILYELARTL